MDTDEKMKIYFEYRYLIDKILQKYFPDKPNYEELYNAGIAGLFKGIYKYEDNNKRSHGYGRIQNLYLVSYQECN